MDSPTPQPPSNKGAMVALGVVAALLLIIVVVLGALLVTREDTDTADTDTVEDVTEDTSDDTDDSDTSDDNDSSSSSSSNNGSSNNNSNNTSNTNNLNNQADVNNGNNNRVDNNNEEENENEAVTNTTFSIVSPTPTTNGNGPSFNAGNVTFTAAFQNGKPGQFITVSVSSRGGNVSNLGPCQILYAGANKSCQINVPKDTYFSNQNSRYQATFTLYDVDGSTVSTQRTNFTIR